VLVDQQNANILPRRKLIKRILDIFRLRLRVHDQEVLAAVWRGRNVADPREEHACYCVLQRENVRSLRCECSGGGDANLIADNGQELAVFVRRCWSCHSCCRCSRNLNSGGGSSSELDVTRAATIPDCV